MEESGLVVRKAHHLSMKIPCGTMDSQFGGMVLAVIVVWLEGLTVANDILRARVYG